MSNDKTNANSPRRGGWLRKLAWVLGIFLVLLVVAYFVLTSGAFVKSVILPKVGSGMNSDLTAADVSLSPFSQLVLKDVKLTPKGKETLLTAGLVRVRYSLTSIMGGNMVVDEVTVESPVITVIENADGTSNLDPITKAEKPAEKTAAEKKPSAAPKVDIKLVAIKNGTVKKSTAHRDGGRDNLELSNVNFTLTDLKNGGTGKIDLSGGLAMDQTGTTNAAALASTLGGNFTFDLSPDLKPGKINGKANFDISKATGSFAQFNGLKAAVDADATTTEIKQLAVHFTQSGQPIGEIRASGPLDASKSEGKLNVIVSGIDRRVLNLVGASSGVDFGTTTINSTNVIELTSGGKIVTATGQLDAARMRITRAGQSTPTLDLRGDYAVTVDNNAQTAQLRTLNLTGTQDSRPLLKSELTSPMTISLGGANAGAGDATFNLSLINLNLADWRAFAADLSPAGTVNATLKLNSQQGGKLLNFDLDGKVAGLSAKMGDKSINQSDITLRARGTGTDMKLIKLTEYSADLSQNGQSALTLNGSGTIDNVTKDMDLQLVLRTTVSKLLAMFPQPDTKFSGGAIDLTGHVTVKGDAQTVTGKLTVANLTGNYGSYRFTDYGTTADLDVATKTGTIEIRKANGELHQASNAGGKFDLSGKINTESKAGTITLKLIDFNQNGLRPFLESALGNKKLVSVAINSSTDAKFESNGDASVKADLQVANLVVNDPAAPASTPAKPLEAKAQFEAGITKNVAQISKGKLELTPTDRAKVNDINVSGTVDYSKTNAMVGNIKISSDTIDLTKYYELFSGKDTSAKTPAPAKPAPTSSAPPGPQKEPEAVKSPIGNFVLDFDLKKVYIGEVEMTNIHTKALIEASHVTVKPFQLALNGAPINGDVDLDLGVAGYRYNVAFDAKAVPVAPIVNTFQPEKKGQMGGHFYATGKIKGAGITDPSIQKNLTGNFDLGATNLNLAIANVQSKLLRTIVNVISVIPELINSKGASVSSLAGAVLGGNEKRQGGLLDEVSQTPINIVSARGDVGTGKVNLQTAFVESPSFQAEALGTITLAEVLTNSTVNIPLHIWLEQNLAKRVNMVPTGTPTNQVYVRLPDYVTVTKTLGDPKPDYNYRALVGTVITSIGTAIPGVNKETSEKLQKLGDSLLGRTPPIAVTNAPTTNAPASNQLKTSTTNQPTTNAQPTAVESIRGLFDQIKKPKATNAPPPKSN